MCNNMFICTPTATVQAGPTVTAANPLNRMCDFLDESADRDAFLANEDEYCLRFGLTKRQRRAVKSRDFLQVIDNGGHLIHLIHLDRLAALVQQTTLDAAVARQSVSNEMLIAKLLRIAP